MLADLVKLSIYFARSAQKKPLKTIGASFWIQPVGFALFGCNGDTSLISQDGVGHHQQRARCVFGFDLLSSPRCLWRGAQQSCQASGLHVVNARATSQSRDDVHRGGATQAVLAAGGRSRRGQGVWGAVAVGSRWGGQTWEGWNENCISRYD